MVRIGLIGVGRFCSSYHISNLLEKSDAEVVAVCDISPERLAGRDERLGACATFSDYRDLLDPDRVDGVIVSTPISVHFEPCKLALARGIPVLVDKPFTKTARQAEELVRLSRSNDTVLITAFTRHFFPGVEYVRRQIASGVAGDLQMLTAVQRGFHSRPHDPNGGMLLGRGVHIADLLPWLTGRRVAGVEGRVENADEGYETRVDVRLELEGGLSGRMFCITESEANQDEVTVYGTQQSFRLDRREDLYTSRQRDWLPVTDLPAGSNSTAYFIDLLQGRASEDSPADLHSEDGLRSIRVLEAIVEAGKTGRFVEIPEE